jgi:hypothetical protein
VPNTTNRTLRTSDLALATFMNLQGHRHLRLEMVDRRSACWVFSPTEAASVSWEVYQDGDAGVEPLAYSRKLREVRDELYQFLKSNRS